MGSSYTKIYVHLVWATSLREALLVDAIAPRLHGYLAARCRELQCVPLAVGGQPEHVHVLFALRADLAVARLAQELKAPSTRFLHRVLHLNDFAWQEGYGAFSLRDTDVETVRHYIINQDHHHAAGTALDTWERCEPP